jgi:hypothetical protein
MMVSFPEIPPPFLMNPLKHHLGFIRGFINKTSGARNRREDDQIVREIRQLGLSVMDIYTGRLSPSEITGELVCILSGDLHMDKLSFSEWTGKGQEDFRTARVSDGSDWVLKYYEDDLRYVHTFPARNSKYAIRVKSNTLKSAMLYLIYIDRDYITEKDLNKARAIYGLPPVKNMDAAQSINEMIEILRN